ncbi:ABC transporter permease [Prauserella marina]|uniref:Osmoprotectant transport system permease protein n=1 Tax=Prauserella marina TaxID=530584 RepID=A0A222W081_9PSEU|nr:ABC transporter permease [Prauserella marina]ASR39442.1 ABC transporter permease [Prauserella marina]PWV80367.1 osmoprotectant transport system permease protein [Prauserella marina]SDD52780.1 osmoprotectant transport system permease protein [Prauserella marina]
MNILTLFWDWLSQPAQWSGPDSIPARFGEHTYYSALSLLIAAAIGIPFGLLTGHTGRGGFIAATLANFARALPTVGVVMLVVLAVGIGLQPVVAAMVALAIPPILVNTYEGIRSVDAQLKDAAQGMGMTGPEVLRKVEIPVALPLILLGLRTAAIQIVSTATIAAYVGMGGLGRFIFDGLARQDYELVVGGAGCVVLLAVIVTLIFLVLRKTVVAKGVLHRESTS